jgi:triosephosphate isomerase
MFSLYANWKSNKNLTSTRAWFYTFREQLSPESQKLLQNGLLEIVVFPPVSLIYPLHTLCIDVPGVSVGVQDISPLNEGKFTGLVNASSVVGMASHAIVGHVEERQRGDTEEVVIQKYQQAVGNNLIPVLCISKPSELIAKANFVAYEPVEAIGSGNNATPTSVSQFKNSLSHQPKSFIYGGSVNVNNCNEYLQPRICDGFLVGQISLDAADFASLTNTCASYVAG